MYLWERVCHNWIVDTRRKLMIKGYSKKLLLRRRFKNKRSPLFQQRDRQMELLLTQEKSNVIKLGKKYITQDDEKCERIYFSHHINCKIIFFSNFLLNETVLGQNRAPKFFFYLRDRNKLKFRIASVDSPERYDW